MVIVGCAIPQLADGQTPNAGANHAGEVFLSVTVTDKYGRWVSGLSKEQFKIYEEKQAQEITSFSSEEGPLSVGILIDVSGSALDYIDDALEAVKYFVKGCKTETEYFVIAFDVKQELIQESTDQSDKVMDAINGLGSIKPKALTAFFDALDVGLEKVSKGKHARKALLVFSDAVDNESKRSFSDIKRKLRSLDVNLYALKSGPYGPHDEWAIKEIVELTGQTGGRAMFTDGRVELAQAAYRTAEELRYQYRLGFKPQSDRSNKHRDQWRNIDVKVELPRPVAAKIGKVNVRARRGYNPGLAPMK
jgi:Ca-activated chloride channel family protein